MRLSGGGQQGLLVRAGKLGQQALYFFVGHFYIDTYPAVPADDGRGKMPGMRNAEMMAFIGQKWLAAVGHLDEGHRQIGEEMLEQVAARKVL